MRVIGTAGHVDHGKSTLIAALTGTHPDRLKEERAREMTIDLGFASLQLPGGELIGIVDVPGHRDFIENMLAGVGGIDAALFVVAADEGVMPQTREHLAILDILQVQGGVIALTKTDLIEDPEWFDLVESDIRQVVHGTVLQDAPLVRVSARTRAGLSDLTNRLQDVLAQSPPRADLGRPRLPVDRVFTMPGFGTVVTGTLTDGHFQLGEEVEVLPSGKHGRVRGLQTHNKKEEIAVPGSRTAVNISGIDLDEIQRGAVVALPGQYQATRWVDVSFRLLPDVSGPLHHSSEVKFFLGTAEVLGRVRLLGVEEFQPGDTGWLQLELRDPVVALRGDHYILRRPSPGETLGGGLVVDPHPKGRHKRFSEEVLASLEALLRGTPEDIILQASQALGPAPLREVIKRARLEAAQAQEVLPGMFGQKALVVLEEGDRVATSEILVISRPQWETLIRQVGEQIDSYHRNYPLRRGMPREELKSRLKLSPRVFNSVVRTASRENHLIEDGAFLHNPAFKVNFSPIQQAKVNNLLAHFRETQFAPPGVKEAQVELGDELYNALVENGLFVPVSPDVVFLRDSYEVMLAGVRKQIEAEGSITLAQFRDQFNTTRKYAQAFLEHLDQSGVTIREGDFRKLRKSL